MARTRHVYPVDMVAHLWAHKAQESARNGGNFYFDGDTIYSYGSHFPIARHVETRRGRAVLFTTRDYSVTTSGHKWTVLGACKHLTVFHVQHPTDTDRKAQFAEYRERYLALARKYSRARSNKPWILGSLRDLVDEANRFAQFFGLRCRLSLPDDLSGMVAECQAIEKRERDGSNAKRQRGNASGKRGRRKLWAGLTSGPTAAQSTVGHSAVMTCQSVCGSKATNCRPRAVQVFLLPTPSRLSGLSNGCAARANPMSATGTPSILDTSPLTPLTSAGNVRAGCHEVAWAEIERVATLAGVN